MQKRLSYIDIAPKAINILYTQEAYFHEQFRQSDTINIRAGSHFVNKCDLIDSNT